MAVYLPPYRAADGALKRSKVYWMEFNFHGQPIRESTGTRSITLAKKIQDKRRREVEEGTAGIRKKAQPQLFSSAATAYLEAKQSSLAASSLMIEKANLAHLKPEFGRNLVCDIEAVDVSRYQKRGSMSVHRRGQSILRSVHYGRFSGGMARGPDFNQT